MDRAELSGAIIAELGAVFTEALTAAAPTFLTLDLDGLERQVQALGRQVLGQVVEQVVAARAAASSAALPACEQCGGPTRCVGRGGRARCRGWWATTGSTGRTTSVRPATPATRRSMPSWGWTGARCRRA